MYRSEDRVSVLQALVHTLETTPSDLPVFLKAHDERNLAEYQGRVDVDKKLLTIFIRCESFCRPRQASLLRLYDAQTTPPDDDADCLTSS